tara:strand:- start:1100 stop:1252 length:153 start_codon:yes stop_codon:yes gene_type:complete
MSKRKGKTNYKKDLLNTLNKYYKKLKKNKKEEEKKSILVQIDNIKNKLKK